MDELIVIVVLSCDVVGGGIDYDSGPFTVTIQAGQISSILTVPINDDNILEGNENFNVHINQHSLPIRVFVGDRDQATVTILDDDGKNNSFCIIGSNFESQLNCHMQYLTNSYLNITS